MHQTTTDGAGAQAQEKAQEVAGQAKEQAQQAAGQAKEQARTQIDQRSTQAGQQINQQAGDIRTVGEKLREEGKDGPAKIADQAAQRVEKVGQYLEQSDADRILGDVEDFARQRPWAVVAGGIALGLAASRFLKASQGDRYRSTVQQRQTGGPGTTGTPSTATTPGLTPGGNGHGNELSTGVGVPRTPVTAPAIPATPPAAPSAHPVSPGTGAL